MFQRWMTITAAALETVAVDLACKSERCGVWRHMISMCQIQSE
jgi:hypothetical protein